MISTLFVWFGFPFPSVSKLWLSPPPSPSPFFAREDFVQTTRYDLDRGKVSNPNELLICTSSVTTGIPSATSNAIAISSAITITRRRTFTESPGSKSHPNKPWFIVYKEVPSIAISNLFPKLLFLVELHTIFQPPGTFRQV